jgi:hypothetical protein
MELREEAVDRNITDGGVAPATAADRDMFVPPVA